jgi:hypothetical protein
MSLILDALRKLDREKGVPSRGFVVLAPGAKAPAAGSRGVLLIALALVLGLVGAVTLSRLPAPPAAPPAPAHDLAPPTPTLPAIRMPEPSLAPPKAVPSGAASPRTFVLEAISERDGSPVAVVNDHLVKEGDLVDGARIVRIGADEVEIEVAGTHRVVRF